MKLESCSTSFDHTFPLMAIHLELRDSTPITGRETGTNPQLLLRWAAITPAVFLKLGWNGGRKQSRMWHGEQTNLDIQYSTSNNNLPSKYNGQKTADIRHQSSLGRAKWQPRGICLSYRTRDRFKSSKFFLSFFKKVRLNVTTLCAMYMQQGSTVARFWVPKSEHLPPSR